MFVGQGRTSEVDRIDKSTHSDTNPFPTERAFIFSNVHRLLQN